MGYYSQLHGLLITVLGPRSDFHHSRTPGCIYVTFINTRTYGRFWPVSWAINHRYMGYYSPFWVPGVISTIDEPQGAFSCRSSTLALLSDSGQFHGLLFKVTWAINHRFRSPGRFPPLTTPRVHLRDGHQPSHFWTILACSWAINHRFGSPE